MLRLFIVHALLAVFFAVGVYTLNRRFRYREEFSLQAESLMLAGLIVFFAIELNQFRILLKDSLLFQIFASLALFVSALALYGHILISFGSRLVLEMVSHGGSFDPEQPRFGPAEALEHHGDFEGALSHYQVLARIFPSNAEVYARMANCHLELSAPKEAAKWFQHALKHLKEEQERLTVINRLCEVFERRLGNRDAARRLLAIHLEMFPASPSAESLARRIQRLSEAPAEEKPVSAELTALDVAPLEVIPEQPTVRRTRTAERIELEAMNTPLGTLPGTEPESPATAPKTASAPISVEAIDSFFALEPAPEAIPGPKKKLPGLESLDEALDPIVEELPSAPSPEKRVNIGLEALEDAQEEAPVPPAEPQPPKSSPGIGLDAL